MDPNAKLARLRYMANRASGLTAHGLLEFVQAFRELDGYLSGGGYPPEAWREGPPAFGEDYQPPELRPWLYDSGHESREEQAGRVEQLSAARPDAEVEGRVSDGGLFEVWIRPKDEAPTRVDDVRDTCPKCEGAGGYQTGDPFNRSAPFVTCDRCGGLGEVPARVENPHRITTYWTAFGWTWGCACGAEGRSNAAPTQTAAYAYGERHIRHALHKAAASH